MRISVVTCSYNQARYIDATIRSVLEQAYEGLEYIVIDGGSDDGSVDIIRAHEAALAFWVSESDEGQTDALIKGFQRATGEVLGWLCSDDLLLPGALEEVATYFENNPDCLAVYGDSIWIDDEGRFIRPKREMGFNRFVFLHDHNYLPQPSVFWRRSLYEDVGGLSPDFSLAMDSDLWERFSRRTRMAHIPRFLSCMRYYPEQKTRSGHWRARGRHEGDLIRQRGAGALMSSRLVRPLMWVLARGCRVLQKSATGGYSSDVPQEVRAWLDQQAAVAPSRLPVAALKK